MKKIVIASIILIFILTACGINNSQFVGNSSGNNNMLVMDYSIFNKSYSQKMNLEKGDIIEVNVTNDTGHVSLIVKGSNKELYSKKKIANDSFEIAIEEDDIYDVEVIGYNAAGKLSIQKK